MNTASLFLKQELGGYAYSHDVITLAIQKDFADKMKQTAELRGTVFHESFHLSQRFTGEDGHRSALHSAIYEGCATVFEREYANVLPLYGNYNAHSDEQLADWFDKLGAVGMSYREKEGEWEEWAFYHHELQQRWIVYKTGTWLVDQTLKQTGLNILDLQNKTAEEILALHAS
jgi:uncharacterized protein YjaZ